MKNSNKNWISLILSMWLVIVMTLIAIVVLDFAIPFSKDIKWIENATNTYYQVNSWFEEAIYFVSQNSVWSESWKTILANKNVDYWFNISASWKISPLSWKWNSDFDSDWNKIFEWNSVQMEIWFWKISDWVNISKAYFRVPNLNWNWWLTLSWWSLPIINWKLSSENKSLDATWSLLLADKICKSSWNISNTACTDKLIFNDSLFWLDSNLSLLSFKDFYESNCWASSWCILKLSVINPLTLTPSNTKIPYLEWKIDFWNNAIPTRYTDIEASGKSYWFKKEINFWVPQKTGLDTFDFTVFQ